MAVKKAISSLSRQSKGKYIHAKTVSVDIPCSRKTFVAKFVQKVNNVEYNGQDNFKCTLGPSDLRPVFGEKWDYFMYDNSSTRRRIIGIVTLHFRKKSIALNIQDLTSR